MISEIIKFDNIGTPNYISEISNLIQNEDYNKKNISDFFINKIIDDRSIFDGGLFFLEYIGFIKENDKNLLYIPNKYKHLLNNKNTLKYKVISMFIDKWRMDSSFNEIFNYNTLSYYDEHIIVDNSAFKFKYAKLKQLLIDFDFLRLSSVINNCYLVNNKYKKYFHKNKIKPTQLSLSELNRIKDLKEKYGNEAEIFVLNLETQKFKNHDLIGSIEQISIINSSAGYDIVSIMDKDSITIDKFIEVKSYSSSKNNHFYWSKNEVEVAKQKKDNYFLYLVDRDYIHEGEYYPRIIQNPYDNVFEKYNRDCQSWKFYLND